MNIEELVVGARAYNVLKDAGIDTVEDLCLFTGEQLMRLGNFGRKSLDDVQSALSEHSLSLHTGPADPRLIVSCPGVGRRFNLGLSVANRGRESLAAYTARELARVQESLLLLATRVTGQTRTRLLTINGHVGMLRSVTKRFSARAQSNLKARDRILIPTRPRTKTRQMWPHGIGSTSLTALTCKACAIRTMFSSPMFRSPRSTPPI
jgi:hypothetical protein